MSAGLTEKFRTAAKSSYTARVEAFEQVLTESRGSESGEDLITAMVLFGTTLTFEGTEIEVIKNICTDDLLQQALIASTEGASAYLEIAAIEDWRREAVESTPEKERRDTRARATSMAKIGRKLASFRVRTRNLSTVEDGTSSEEQAYQALAAQAALFLAVGSKPKQA